MTFVPSRSFVAATIVAVVVGTATTGAAQQTAFRMTTLRLVEPHIFLSPTCPDLTGLVNGAINAAVVGCEKLDPNQPNAEPCELTFNLLAVFNPLVQTPGTELPLHVAILPSCISDGGVVDCSGEPPDPVIPTTYNSLGAGETCLGAIPGTVGPMNMGNYTPPVVATTGPCAVSDVLDLELNLGDITIPLQGAQVAAQYNGDPATSLVNGLARGFLPADVAAQIVLDVPPLVGVQLSSLLKGGEGSMCQGDDRDFNPPDDMNGERGWWFYLSFTANPVVLPEIVVATPTATEPEVDTPTPTPPEPTSTHTPVDTATPTETPTQVVPTDTPTMQPPEACPGDCDGNGSVPIEEVQMSAGVFLGDIPLSSCPAADADGSGSVFIFELQRVVNSFRLGCP